MPFKYNFLCLVSSLPLVFSDVNHHLSFQRRGGLNKAHEEKPRCFNSSQFKLLTFHCCVTSTPARVAIGSICFQELLVRSKYSPAPAHTHLLNSHSSLLDSLCWRSSVLFLFRNKIYLCSSHVRGVFKHQSHFVLEIETTY